MPSKPILDKGRNCWRIEPATRVSFLIDGDAYFRAFRRAALNARRSIHILAWDINSRVRLVREETDDDAPVELAEFLQYLLERNPDLEIYILTWDFAMIYAMEREWLPELRFRWGNHQRIHFQLDDKHPIGASHHQKVVIVDNRIAFAGGLDISIWRWDTSDHRAEHHERKDPSGKPYQPYHDVMMLVEGEVVLALSELFASRWRRATKQSLNIVSPEADQSPWPSSIPADIENVDVAVALTFSSYRDQPIRLEVERLYLDAIASARSFIYIENQYVSSRSVADALADRLSEENGPEVIMILPENTGGWLERHTMDLMRIRVIKQLEEADKHGRFGVYYPSAAGEEEQEVYVHAKLQIVDDRFVRVGSSNLSNRSMGFDSECDLAIEAPEQDRVQRAIRTFRGRLLADHFGWSKEEMESALDSDESILTLIRRSIREKGKTLVPMKVDFESDLDRQIAEARWLDPERPVDPDVLIREVLPEDQRVSARSRVVLLASLIGAALLVVVLWRWGPLAEALDSQAIENVFTTARDHPMSPLIAVSVFLLGGSVGVPLNLLLVAAAVVFGPWTGFLYGYCGAIGSSVLAYGFGHLVGSPVIRRLAGPRWKRLNRQLASKGILFVALIRLVPVAPFLVVNLVAGISRIRLRDFVIGTAAGLAPGMLAVTFLTDRFRAAFQNPEPGTILILVVSVLAVVSLVLLVRRWLGRRKPDESDQNLDE